MQTDRAPRRRGLSSWAGGLESDLLLDSGLLLSPVVSDPSPSIVCPLLELEFVIHALDRFGHWLTFYTQVVSFAFSPVRSPTRSPCCYFSGWEKWQWWWQRRRWWWRDGWMGGWMNGWMNEPNIFPSTNGENGFFTPLQCHLYCKYRF